MSTLGTHAVKVRSAGDKRWSFITPGGGTTHLRIHAATMSEEGAVRQAEYIPAHNEGTEARAVRF
jgi:hypothetical protein